MTRRLKVSVAVSVLAVAAVAAVVGVAVAAAAGSATPGLTKTSIKIGGTFPLTGPAQLYGVIPKAENAYFQYVNDHGGVNGRKIKFVYYDDGYNPAQTVPLTKKLVQQDKVFAVYGSLGTAPILATRDYLNKLKVPQVLVATGDSYWATQFKKYPWTTGFQPDYPGESKVYGQFIRNKVPQAKIGVLMQDDAYGQNYYNGLLAGLGDAKAKVVDVEKYDATQTDVSQQVVKLKASGANVFALFATPTQTITALVVATKIGWKPVTFINNVSASPLFMALAQKSGANVQNDITATYVYDTINNPDTATTKLYESILAKYDKGADPNDSLNIYGVASAWTFVNALKQAGPNPTRQGLIDALMSMKKVVNPFLYPGVKMSTSKTDHFLIEQQILEQYKGQAWKPFGHLFGNAR
jgi:branched-chain amino acid transport system substrate-binding protein